MDYCETNQDTQIKILLTDDELQLPALNQLLKMGQEWIKLSKECPKGVRKTRSANKKGDSLYEEIMAFKLPPLKLNPFPVAVFYKNTNNNISSNNNNSTTDYDSDTSSNRPITRSLRSRSRTPTLQQQQNSSSSRTSPCTPQNQRLRCRLNKQQASGSSNALNHQQQQPSAAKLRQLLRADSVKKKNEEEKERQERLLLDRKAKEERAEAQKRQLLEERAIKAKLKREERLNHAAEVRKAREETRKWLKHKNEARRAQVQTIQQIQQQLNNENQSNIHLQQVEEEKKELQEEDKIQDEEEENQEQKSKLPPEDVKVVVKSMEVAETIEKVNMTQDIIKTTANETFKLPPAVNNIDIIVQDETDDGQSTDKIPNTATWARAPLLREALVEKFSKPYREWIEPLSRKFQASRYIDDNILSEIFGPRSAVNKKYLYRTSSAVWTPPNRAVKRRSSQLTPTLDK